MHRNLAGALALALVVAFGAVTARAEGGINWVSDLDAAKKQAAEQKRLILVNFWAEWWSWCKKLEADSLANADVIGFVNANFVNLKINKDENESLAAKYGVQGIPATLFLDATGDKVGEIGGYEPPADFLRDLKKAIDDAQKYQASLAAVNEKLAKDANDVLAHAEAGKIYLDHGAPERAIEHYNKVLELDKDNAKGLHAEAHYRLGHAGLVKSGDVEGAKKHFEETKKLDPNNEKGLADDIAWFHVEVALRETDPTSGVDGLVATLDSFLKEHGKSEFAPKALLYKGATWFQTGKMAEGLELIKQVVRDYPQSEEAAMATSQWIPAMEKQMQEGNSSGGDHGPDDGHGHGDEGGGDELPKDGAKPEDK